MRWLRLLAVLALGLTAATTWADDKPKRVLLVTHSGGFIHDSVAFAEQVLKEIGPKHGLEFTCYRFTGDPDAKGKTGPVLEEYSARFRKSTGEPVTREQCGRIDTATLAKFDCVLFFTTGSSRNISPLTAAELTALTDWVRNGGAFAGTHCATDTLYGTPYGELVGAFFDGHPWHQKIRLRVEDPKHPAAKGFTDGAEITDEMYQFAGTPYSRDRLHIILSIDNGSIEVAKGKRSDKDYAVAWCQQIGKGRSFYTSLGHRKEVWKDPRFQEHLIGGLKWAMGLVAGDATPSGKAKASAVSQ
jgi:type 1 glutamine amidotransferase